MSKQAADVSHIGRWFLGNALSLSNRMVTKLVTLGVMCVKHLQEYTAEEWATLFAEEAITSRVAYDDRNIPRTDLPSMG